MEERIIIVGAGAAGLMAAKELSAKKHAVVLLEANAVAGGRMHTIQDADFPQPVETGAEFIHGKLPVTLQLMREAGIGYEPVAGKMIRVVNGQWHTQDAFVDGWDEMLNTMQELQDDMTVAAFLQQYFGGEQHADLREMVKRFAEGYDLADTEEASILALRDEWMHEEEEQYRVTGGYIQLTDHLQQECIRNGCAIHTSCIVKRVDWKRDHVQVTCADGRVFTGNKIVFTVSPNIWRVAATDEAAIAVEPAVTAYSEAMRQVGFGAVVKVQVLFRDAFWLKKMDDIGFLLSSEAIPTWWTQSSPANPLLTGWLGGPSAQRYQHTEEARILEDAIHSLAAIFNATPSEIRGLMAAWHITNWCHAPFVKGAYSYTTLQTTKAIELLMTPVEQTIYFAGESVYQGPHPGTVEAALVTGMQVAAVIAAGQ